LTRKKQGREEK